MRRDTHWINWAVLSILFLLLASPKTAHWEKGVKKECEKQVAVLQELGKTSGREGKEVLRAACRQSFLKGAVLPQNRKIKL
ncbi:MAG: hypothetical protein NUV60_01360 [Patescibacteria group bacterium]|nr:hypothetical protein [Patescibacteria group bacterium]